MSGHSPHHKGLALKVAVSAWISFGIMIVDFVWLMRDEVKFVWPRLRASWTARIYMLARYFGLASQIYNVYFTVRMYLGIYTSPRGCRIWFTYQALTIQFLLIFVEGLLMHRTYALFLRSRLILAILTVFALCQGASMWVSAGLSFPSNKHTTTCLMVRSNPGNAFFSATTMTTNSMLFFMTFWRYFRLPAQWTRGSLGRVVLRDSAYSLSAITVIMLFLTLCSLEVIKPIMTGNITYYWLMCVLWVSVGRIIVNYEKLPRDEGEQGEDNTWKGTLQLTSQIEMGQSVLSLDTQCGSSDGQRPTSGTLNSSLSMPMTKASQVSPSRASTNDSSRRWLGDCSPSGDGHRYNSQPSSTVVSTEVSTPQLPLSSVSKSDGDAPQPGEWPHADVEHRAQSPSSIPLPPSPRPSSSEPTPPETPP